MAGALAAATTPVQNVPPVISIDGTVGASRAHGIGSEASGVDEATDLIASVRPQVKATRQGPRFSYDLEAAATFQAHSEDTADNAVLPDVHASMKSTLVERWAYFDADAFLRYAEADPFGARADTATGVNRSTEAGYLVRPFLEHEFAPNASVLLRDEFGTTSSNAAERTRLTSNRVLFQVERKPTPLGASASYSRLDNRTDGDQGDSRYTLETARVAGALKVGEDLELGLDAGVDRSDDHFVDRRTDALYGGRISWSPGPRTSARLELEHRYFGLSGRAGISHRTPFTSIGLSFERQPVDSTNSLGTVSQGADLRDFLNSILTTRYPDPTVRAGVVDNLVAQRGLNSKSDGAVNILGNYPQLNTSVQLNWTLLGRRDTLSVSGYSSTSRAITLSDAPLSGLGSNDSRQRGMSFQYNHRLGLQVSAGLVGSWSRIAGLGTRDGELSTEQKYRLSLVDALSPHSDFSIALQWTRFTTNALGQPSFDATLGVVGLAHRF